MPRVTMNKFQICRKTDVSLAMLWFKLCLLSILASRVISVFFLVGTERKCFTIEQPRDTPVLFVYKILDKDHEVIFDLYYGSLGTPDQQIMNKVLKEANGHVDFVADNDGYYSYCVQQATASLETPTRLDLKVSYGYDNDHYEKLVVEHNFDTVNLQVHKLNDILTMTLNEADYQKHKEVLYHDSTEKMNNAALWWPVVQIGILIVTGVYQVQHLKTFFKNNKLI